ncbi:hypothetical protein UT300003_32160 [Clostridium sardiniense]
MIELEKLLEEKGLKIIVEIMNYFTEFEYEYYAINDSDWYENIVQIDKQASGEGRLYTFTLETLINKLVDDSTYWDIEELELNEQIQALATIGSLKHLKENFAELKL